MKRLIFRFFWLPIVVLLSFIWLFLTPTTSFKSKSAFFVITENNKDKSSLIAELEKKGVITHSLSFSVLSSTLNIWGNLKPGKYEVKKGANHLSIVRMLKNGRLAEISLVINRLRTKEDLASLIGKNFLVDSLSVMRYISSNDSLKEFNIDTNTLFTLILPNTYSFYWNTPISKMIRKLADYKTVFWNENNRLEKARSLNLTPEQVYTLASIVEEETNYDSDKIKISSVYVNRLHTGMPLQACPTIKFAMKDFTITRIYEKYLLNPSPYNTYRHKGLPPGPICTPAAKTIDIILEAPKTNYLFFVAKSDFSGYHHFSSNFAEHNQYAKAYQKALDFYMANKQNTEKKH